MYLNWAKKLKTKKILKKFYKKYNFHIFKLIELNIFKMLTSCFQTKLTIYFLKIIRFKNYLYKFKKFLKKKQKLKLRKILKKKLKPWVRIKLKKKLRKKTKYIFYIFSSLKSKKLKINELVYFLKYFSVLRKRQSRIFNLSRVKAKLSKRRFFLKKILKKKLFKYFLKKKKNKRLLYKKRKQITLINLNLYFKKNKRYFRLHRLYDIRKKYIRYLNNNRNIYKFYKFRIKHNYKFIKRHIRTISTLNIKSRIHMYEFSLRNLIIKLKYAFTQRNAENFIKGGFIFLNGTQELNPFKYIYKGDTLELIYSKFIFKLKSKIKKKLNISMRRFKRYNWRTLKNKVNPEKRRIRISRFSEKVLNYKMKITKLFQYDYRTMSFTMVSDVKYKKDLSYLNKKLLPIYLLKLFNWKLIS